MIQDLDPRRVFKIAKNSFFRCLIVAVAFALVSFLISSLLIKTRYNSTISLYVNNDIESTSVNVNDINASQKLANTYVIVLERGNVFKELSAQLDGKYSEKELRQIVSLAVIDNTEVIQITVQMNDADESAKICDMFVRLVPKELEEVVNGGSVKIIGEPKTDKVKNPISASIIAIFMFVLGYFIVFAWYVIRELTDDKIHEETDLLKRYNTILLGSFPDPAEIYQVRNKGSTRKSIDSGNYLITEKTPALIFENYNKASVNLQFLMSEEKNRTIIVTSDTINEQRFSAVINLSVSLAQSGMKVLLIDADLRKPILHKFLKCGNSSGLSNLIEGFDEFENCVIENARLGLDFLPSGYIPPNPSALLASPKTKALLEKSANRYDYVIVNSAPVNLVSDTALLSQYSAGVLLLLQRDVSSFSSIDSAVLSLENVNAKLLGFLLTNAMMPNELKKVQNYGQTDAVKRSMIKEKG